MELKTIDIKGRPYVLVNDRLKYFRENFKDWSLETEVLSLTNDKVVLKAVIKNPEGRAIATGLAYETADSSFINKTSYIENCETSAWGRALANMGIGIDKSVASADEVANAVLNQSDSLGIDNVAACEQILQNVKEDFKKITTLEELEEYWKLEKLPKNKIGYLHKHNQRIFKEATQLKDELKTKLEK